jgi:hypothetical protein
MSDEVVEEQEQEVLAQEDKVEQVEVKEEPKEDPNVINWRQANEVMRLQKQRIEELERFQQEAAQKQAPVEEPDEFANEDPENYITVDKARRMAEKAAEKKAKAYAQQAVQEYAQKQALTLSEERARTKYEDYDYVMKNFAIPLIQNDPALAYKIQQSANPAETAYKLGKLSDDYEETMTKAAPSPKAEKILKNSQRPTSSNAAGSLKTQADKYASMSPAEIWAESQKYARRA